MRKRIFALFLLAALVSFWFVGCDKGNSTEPSMSDRDAITSIIANDALFKMDDALLNDGEPSTASALFSLSKAETPIIPRAWGRKIESFSRSVDFAVLTDSTAVATITHSMTGFLWIRAKYSPQDTSISTIKKNFTEITTRIAKFVRIDRYKDAMKNWKISELSAVKGGTASSSITIDEIRFYSGSDTVIVTDPNTTFLQFVKGRGRCIPELLVDINTPFRVQITVTSSSPDSDFVTAHRPFMSNGKWNYRAPMSQVSSTTNSNGTFTRVYEHAWKGMWQGRHNLLVSALTRNSIFDDDPTKFSSQIWGIPFIAF
jgi:hypothetical protein